MSVNKNEEIEVSGVVTQGHQVASGLSTESPYPEGSVSMQLPFFQERGVDFGEIYPGTLNISIVPRRFRILKADYYFPKVEWTHLHPPEDFSFVSGKIKFVHTDKNRESWQPAFIYYPHPETKKTHFSNDTILEILTAYKEGVSYGSRVQLCFHREKIDFFN